MLIQEHCGEQLCAADVEILPDASGRPVVEGAWKQRLRVNPVSSDGAFRHRGGCGGAGCGGVRARGMKVHSPRRSQTVRIDPSR
jgi:hypothetical protein